MSIIFRKFIRFFLSQSGRRGRYDTAVDHKRARFAATLARMPTPDRKTAATGRIGHIGHIDPPSLKLRCDTHAMGTGCLQTPIMGSDHARPISPICPIGLIRRLCPVEMRVLRCQRGNAKTGTQCAPASAHKKPRPFSRSG